MDARELLAVAGRVVDWHGCLILLLLGLGWALAARAKTKEVERLRQGRPCSHYSSSSSRTSGERTGKARAGGRAVEGEVAIEEAAIKGRPSVFILVPAKGVKEHSMRNWKTFAACAREYGGDCEIAFCVEDESDDAYRAVRGDLLVSFPEIVRDVILCGRAKTCSQKLHNIVTGITALKSGKVGSGVDWEYVMFLDDDIRLHSKLLDNLAETLSVNKEAFMCTAYPFDVPCSDAASLSFLSFCIAAYHLRLIIAFSLGYATTFVWGGCMMYRKEDLVHDAHGLVSSWMNGGYSDDLIASSISQANGLMIMCNPSSVLLQELPKKVTWSQYWNYTKRQVFVLDTYGSSWHKRLNHMLIGIHVYLSSFFVAAMALNTCRYVSCFFRSIFFLLRVVEAEHSEVYQYSVRLAYIRWMRFLVDHLSAVCFGLAFAFALTSLGRFVASMDALFALLYGSASSRGRPDGFGEESQERRKRVEGASAKEKSCGVNEGSYTLKWKWWHFGLSWVALCVDVFLFVPAAVRTLASDEIEWSGTRYWKRNGLIRRVVHTPRRNTL